MTSRERVLAAFEHVEPDHVPVWCGAAPEFLDKAKRLLGVDDEGFRLHIGDDFRRVMATYSGPEPPLGEGVTSCSMFGIERHGLGCGLPVANTLAQATIDDVLAYPWPDPQWTYVSRVRADAEKYGGQYAILGGDWSPFWHDVIDLLGMENMYLKMYDSPQVVDAVFERVVGYYLGVSRRIFDAAGEAIDIFFIGNDFGSQTGPLLSEQMFRRFILPHLKKFVDLGHDCGLKVMLHCCGGFAELIPAMIEIGLDGLHAVQPTCRGMDLRELKRKFGEKMLFNGAIDSQHVLIEGKADYVRRQTREVLEIMMPGGGYVAGASHDYILEETPVENVLAMFDTIREFGVYR